jgi:hypothetical protein
VITTFSAGSGGLDKLLCRQQCMLLAKSGWRDGCPTCRLINKSGLRVLLIMDRNCCWLSAPNRSLAPSNWGGV